jgi:hypothetical protein
MSESSQRTPPAHFSYWLAWQHLFLVCQATVGGLLHARGGREAVRVLGPDQRGQRPDLCDEQLLWPGAGR